ncbi:MAG: hypothetical protein VR64_16165 [Desulfatitalea sp. BRH_c12]|nr:MAG: hypothetical protein VR64_16165 [Desulfatitalea sp. BRH_c12]
MQTIKIEFKIDKTTWQGLDAEKERHGLRQLINNALKRSAHGKWVGSYARDTSLVFYCMVTDETLARNTVQKELSGHHLIRFLQAR